MPITRFGATTKSGPLACGMAGAGFDEIEVVPEGGRRTYIGLGGRRQSGALGSLQIIYDRKRQK
ncbi:hypothetical protein ACG04R_06485 [Roseateles sp. BYS78W]|uniref:Uncharacterized protein n=2 Tax=Pelomonas candidula TaxID=3299025 RepID=A0ABW7H952_9BURK